jgi:phage terminase large subunit-like protein
MGDGMAVDLQRLAADPGVYRDHVVIPGAHGPVRLSAALIDHQRGLYAALDPAFAALKVGAAPPIGRYFVEATKGYGKDTLLAAQLLWLIAFSRRSLVCRVGAADAEQADELRKAAAAIVRLNGWLAGLVDVQASAIICPHTDSRADILSVDASGSHGARPDLTIINELTHIRGETGREFAATLMDDAAKNPRGVVIIATNAGQIDTWQHEWAKQAQRSDRWSYTAYRWPAPWIDPAELTDAEWRNPRSRFRRLFWGEWSSGEGDAIPADEIEAAVTQQGGMTGEEEGWAWAAGLDLGVRKDRAALVVIGRHVGWAESVEQPRVARHPTRMAMEDLGLLPPSRESRPSHVDHAGSGRLRLASVQVWSPAHTGGRIDLSDVEEAVFAASEQFLLAGVAVDPSQAELMVQRLASRGVNVYTYDFTPQHLREMASAVTEEFRERGIDLYPDKDLLADLGALRLVERSYGCRLESPRGPNGHGDAATAFALALVAARSLTRDGYQGVEGPLVWN